jgi:ribosome biogenesis GTPase
LSGTQELLQGLVIHSQAGWMTVRTESGDYPCRVRGRLRRGRAEGDLVAVGDQVMVAPQEDGTGRIEEVLPRHSVLSRQLSGVNYEYQQIILANPDQAFFVFAVSNPEPRLRMLDRFLVVAERAHIPSIIVANKVDLTGLEAARDIFGMYEDIGYQVIYASAKTGQGSVELRGAFAGKLSTLAGPSGVGKSSLINATIPGVNLEVGEVSQAGVGKGKHTTQVKQLIPLPEGGYIADVPGLRTVALWDIEGEELDAYFIEIAPLVPYCQFNDCTHSHEPGCAVREASERGKIHPHRYDSYLRLRFGQAQDDYFEEDNDED